MRPLIALLAALALVAAPAGAPAATTTTSVAQAPVRTVKAGQGAIGYRSVGTGRPLVLIMGLSGTMDVWTPSFVDALAAGGHRVITFDNEGIRRSTAGKGPVTIRRMADDTASLIRALKLKRPDVLGWSMGGMIAQSLARRHPTLLRRLILAATAPGDGRGTAPDAKVLGQLSGSATPAAGGLLGLIFPPGQDAAMQSFAAEIVKYPSAVPAAPPAVTQAQLGASGTWIIGGERSGRPLSRLKLPVLVGGGTLDQLLPIANDRHIAQAIPGAKLVEYDDAGHGFLFQRQADFVGRVLTFLR